MTHYHLVMTRGGVFPMASVKYDNYEDSLVDYVGLSVRLFGHLQEHAGTLSVERAKQATCDGEAQGSFIGVPSMGLYWIRCEDVCISYTWN